MKKAFLIIDILLVIAAIWLGVRLVGRSSPVPIDVMANDTAGEARQAPLKIKKKPLSFYHPIMARNLFKTKEKAKIKKEPINLEALKKTELTLKLWGTVVSEGETVYAVIEDTRKRRQDLYRVGDTIQDAGVKMILREKIVLNVKGKDEILEIEKVAQGPKKKKKKKKVIRRPPKKKK